MSNESQSETYVRRHQSKLFHHQSLESASIEMGLIVESDAILIGKDRDVAANNPIRTRR